MSITLESGETLQMDQQLFKRCLSYDLTVRRLFLFFYFLTIILVRSSSVK